MIWYHRMAVLLKIGIVPAALILLTCTNPFPSHPDFPYDLAAPSLTLHISHELAEVSGLSFTADGRYLAANNDEQGTIFLLDKQTGKIVRKISFRETGDFEGIEIVGNNAFIARSNGTLYEVVDFLNATEPIVHIHKTMLDRKNNVEALGYYPPADVLLVGCKGSGMNDEETPPHKAIFAFDLKTRQLLPSPFLILEQEKVDSFFRNCPDGKTKEQLEKKFFTDSAAMNFSPSGIAVHPISGDIYIVSARGNLLVAITPSGDIQFIEKLKKSILTQPEGICFDADGTLYISSEGKSGTACIQVFGYRN